MYTAAGLVLEPFKLVLQPMPQFARGENCRSRWSDKHWTRLRQALHRKAGYQCELCRQPGDNELHETWEGVEERDRPLIWRLTGLVGLCSGCHAACHLSLWEARSQDRVAVDVHIGLAMYNLARTRWQDHTASYLDLVEAVRAEEADLNAYVEQHGFTLDLTVCHRAMADKSLWLP